MTGCIWSVVAAALAQTPAVEARLTPEAAIRFATAAEGRAAIVKEDAFTTNLSRFDLQARLKTDKEVTLKEWKEFVAQAVRPWEDAERQIVLEAVRRLNKRMMELKLPLPPIVELVRTTGEDESGRAYTRGQSIVLPPRVLGYAPEPLDRLLAHELFHVLSRHDNAVRAKLYRIIGFALCEPIAMPASLAERRITNPDAPLIDCTIELMAANGKLVTAAPVLYARVKQFDPAAGKTLIDYLTPRLLVVEQRGGRWQASLVGDEPVVIDPRKEPAFFEKVGKNTNYIIHPDEILADNFVRLVMEDKELQTPRVVEEMRGVLSR
jgi:hypothetical protein